MPFYARLGFTEVTADTRDAVLAAVVENEAARGLAREQRVVLRYEVRRRWLKCIEHEPEPTSHVV